MKRFEAWLQCWVRFCRTHALAVVLAAVALTAASILHTRTALGINTDTADMISGELEWRQVYKDFKRAFPQFVDTLVVVVDAPTPEQASRASARLVAALGAERALVEWVRDPRADLFFRRNALLYLDVEPLTDLVDRIAEVQPFLGSLSRSPDLAGFAALLEQATEALEDDRAGVDLEPALVALERAASAERERTGFEVSWRELIAGEADDSDSTRRLITVKPILDYSELLPAGPVIERIRGIAGSLGYGPGSGVTVRVTGGVALAYEELESVTRGAAVAGVLALVMVSIVLVVGLRSATLVAATLITLVSGLVLTAGFATVAIGSLNLISVAFAVLYIGLGVDYAIHYCLRYRELIASGVSRTEALDTAAGDVGMSLVLCAVTTGLGFFAFVPTDFSGVSELGLISGVGMFISLVVSLSLLPALLQLLPVPSGPVRVAGRKPSRFRFDARRSRFTVLAVFIAIGLAALVQARDAWFDENPLNLRDPATESVSTYLDLLSDSDTSPWSMDVLVRAPASVDAVAESLRALPEVAEVESVFSLVPPRQREKLDLVEELSLIIGGSLEQCQGAGASAVAGVLGESGTALASACETPQSPAKSDGNSNDPQTRQAAVTGLRASLARLAGRSDGSLAVAAERASTALSRLPEGDEALAGLERRLLINLHAELDALRLALGADSVSLDTLPPRIRDGWVAGDGRYRLNVAPAEDMNDRAALRRFVAAVTSVAPGATGTPLVNLESGAAVTGAFRQAILSALVLIGGLLLLMLERKRDVIFVLAPLALAGAVTMALMVFLDIPFNFANVIALPLLLGIGVDNGVHIVHRARSAPSADGRTWSTSTARGVVVSSLTTICSFGNLAFSAHLGMASMGLVLTIGLASTLICTLVVLPALLDSAPVSAAGAGPGAPPRRSGS